MANQSEELIVSYIETGQPIKALELLDPSININAIASDGDTLLHKAVKAGYVDLAARMLTYGADFGVKNAKGIAPLSKEFTSVETIHAIRQAYHRDVPTTNGFTNNSSVHGVVEKMRRDGIIKVEGLLKGEQLQQIQKDISQLVRKLKWGKLTGRSKYIHYDQREYWQKNHRSYVFNDPLRVSSALIDFCETPFITEAADQYLGKKSHIKRVMGMRYLPSQVSFDKQQFGWHHDMEDRQFKVMVLLTDIGPEDQYMAYIPGTHPLRHNYEHFLTNKITYEDCNINPANATEIHTTGKAGDCYFFDSNGMHRGTRSNGKMRDALFIEYTTDKNWKNIWGTDMDEAMKQKIRNGSGNLLKEYIAVRPKWERAKERTERKLPTWAESLNEPELWV